MGMLNGFMVMGIIFVAGVILLILIWQIPKIWSRVMAKRMRRAEEKAYQKLVEQSLAEQRKMVEEQQRMTDELADITKRIASMEEMMREDE